MTAYKHLDLAIGADKVLGTRDGDIDKLLKLYNISTDTLDTMMTSIRDWYEKQPHLPQGQLHDRMILAQLITRAFSVEQTKDNIDNYFSAKHRMPDLLCGWEPLRDNMDKYIKDGYWILPPMKTKENHRIVIFRIVNPEELIVSDVVKLGFLIRDYRLFNETSVGEHWILDCTNASFGNILQLNPVLMNKLYYHVTSCYAPKLKGIHFVNMPSYGHTVITLFKKVLKPKHVSRLHTHNSFEKVFEFFPRELFPKDLGGTANYTCKEIADNYYEVLHSEPWKQYIKHQDKYFYSDESKRITPAKEYNDRFGVEGSFRKLELD